MPIPNVLPEFRPGQPAPTASAALKQAVRTMDRARHCAVLWFSDIMTRGLFRELGYPSIHLFASQELGFSSTRTGDFVRMARKLDDLPAVRRSLASGKLGYTKAREILKVATPTTEKIWVKTAASTPRRELEKKVALVRAQARTQRHAPCQGQLLPATEVNHRLAASVPVRVQFEMTAEQFARFEALVEKLRKKHHPSAKVDLLLEGLEALLEKDLPAAPRGTNFQVHVRQCPDCGRISAATGRGDLELGPADSGRIRCDSRIDDPGRERNRHTIPPAVRRRVMARDDHRCQTPGCANTRFLEVHHLRPRALGGTNEPANLVTVCGACHRHAHRHDRPTRAPAGAGW